MRVTIHEEVHPPRLRVGAIETATGPRTQQTTEIHGSEGEITGLLAEMGFLPTDEQIDAAFGALEEKKNEALEYVAANKFIPDGRVSSTARRGSKWWNKVRVGDVVDLTITETKAVFGQAVIVAIELLPLLAVLDNADHNHVAFEFPDQNPREKLVDALTRAYGQNLEYDEAFTVLHILPLNN